MAIQPPVRGQFDAAPFPIGWVLGRFSGTVRCDADERQRLEQLCRYITRPALANERVQINSAGQVVLKLKTPWRDGTTHIVMSPLEFMQRLAAPVPWPWLHLIRLHRVETSSRVKTPSDVRSLGGAFFCDRRYGKVFIYHNGAQSYYTARGFRGSLRV